jgi:hypothetical protein
MADSEVLGARGSAPGVGLATAPAPAAPVDVLGPDVLESYVRASMHQDRSPGTVLVIAHPLRMARVPRPLLDGLRGLGFVVDYVETQPERMVSVSGIRDAMRAAHARGRPLDLLVVSGDGSLDHHVLVAAYQAFYPDLVVPRPGALDASALTRDDVARVPAALRPWLADVLPGGAAKLPEPTDATVRQVWLIRAAIERALGGKASPSAIASAAQRDVADPLLRFAVVATLFPDRVVVRPNGYDLEGLAKASQQQTFQGLYPFVRAIACYPAGTAADNALYAGVPGWTYARIAPTLAAIPGLDGLRRLWERRLTRRVLRYFAGEGTVVPARLSVVAFDGDFQVLSSHAAGGPGGGRFFAADLTSKTGGMLGYLARIPSVLIGEGVFGDTIVRIRARGASGELRTEIEGRIAEGLYTNRTFIAGVGTVPSTDATGFAGQATLVVAPPIVTRSPDGTRIDLRGVGTFAEAIFKGVLARALHLVGLPPGSLGGGSKLRLAAPEHQIAVRDGEEIDIAYLGPDRRPRCVPLQVSGDPFQASRMTIRGSWGPIPMLADPGSLLMLSVQRTLARLRVLQTFRLQTLFIGGLAYFRHQVGRPWTPERVQETGLPSPALHLPRRLDAAFETVLTRWRRAGAGPFVDTSDRGLPIGRRGRYAHSSDHGSHCVVLRDRGALIVRLVTGTKGGRVYEARATYRPFAGWWILVETQTRQVDPGQDPTLIHEEYLFRSADAFRQDAPRFFPFSGRSGVD